MSDSDNKRKRTKLSPEQTAALLSFFAQTNPERLTFKQYCDANQELLGESGSTKRRFVQKHHTNWKKRGISSLVKDRSKYPVELVRSAAHSIELLQAKSESSSLSPKPKAKKKIISPSPFSSPQLQRRMFSPQAIRHLMEKDEADFILQMNVDEPFRNIVLVPYRVPQCPEIYPKAKVSKGFLDKLTLNLGVVDIRDVDKHLLWLHHQGEGVFLMLPPAPAFFIIDAEAFHNTEHDPKKPNVPRCAITWERYNSFVEEFSEEEHLVTLFFQFPPGIICSNGHFNKDIDDIDPSDHCSLLVKQKGMKNWLNEPNTDPSCTDAEAQAGRYQLNGALFWEMEILNKDNLSHRSKKKKGDSVVDMFQHLNFGS